MSGFVEKGLPGMTSLLLSKGTIPPPKICVLYMCVCMFYAYECLLAGMCLYRVHPELSVLSDPLELELEVIVSHCVGARNRTQAFCNSKY